MNRSKKMGRPRKPAGTQLKLCSVSLRHDQIELLDGLGGEGRSAAARQVIDFYLEKVRVRTHKAVAS
jgi:hypothetical protein